MTLTIFFHGSGEKQYQDDNDYLTTNAMPINIGSHTMSFLADCLAINAEQNPEPLFSSLPKPDSCISVIKNEVVILVGPDPGGLSVHNLIISGLMAVVNGIMRGERNINFIGFSRGSVEAIHVAHDLQRIKDYVSASQSDLTPAQLRDVICEQSLQWRSSRIKKYYSEALFNVFKNPEYKAQFIQGLSGNDLSLNGKLLDPVPGYCEGPSSALFAWCDGNHYRIPAIMRDLEIAYMDSELSKGFRAVWVEPSLAAITKITRYALPGMHSTANGNPINHHPAPTLQANPNFPIEKMRGVQTVYFYKLLQFIHLHKVSFKAPDAVENRFLSDIFLHFTIHKDHISAQNEFIRQQYRNISTHKHAYRDTRKTCYISKSLGGGIEDIDNERILMKGNDACSSMKDCFNFDFTNEKYYVNFENFALEFTHFLFPQPVPHLAQHVNWPRKYDEMTTFFDIKNPVFTQEKHYSWLKSQIEPLLNECQAPHLEAEFNKILMCQHLDIDGIVPKLSHILPRKLAQSYFLKVISQEERDILQQAMIAILDFKLSLFDKTNASTEEQRLWTLKTGFIEDFQNNMREEISKQTFLVVENLLAKLRVFHQLQFRLKINCSNATVIFRFQASSYLKEAAVHYQSLLTLQDRVQFTFAYQKPEDKIDLQKKITDIVDNFPKICTLVLQKQHVYLSTARFLAYADTQPFYSTLSQNFKLLCLGTLLLGFAAIIATLAINLLILGSSGWLIPTTGLGASIGLGLFGRSLCYRNPISTEEQAYLSHSWLGTNPSN